MRVCSFLVEHLAGYAVERHVVLHKVFKRKAAGSIRRGNSVDSGLAEELIPAIATVEAFKNVVQIDIPIVVNIEKAELYQSIQSARLDSVLVIPNAWFCFGPERINDRNQGITEAGRLT